MADDDRIVVSGGDFGAELLAVPGLKILLRGNQDIGRWIQPQKLRRPLFGQVVWHSKEALLAEPQALALHGGGHHLKGLTAANLMGQERVPAIQHMGNGVQLVLPQGDLRVHAAEGDVAAVVLPGPGGIELFVVELH